MNAEGDDAPRRRPRLSTASTALAGILAFAAALRFYEIGRLSYGYDEVVSATLASADGPRAPLPLLLLHDWTLIFGRSEAAGRSLSAVCGVLTVAWINRIARRAFPDRATALWAAWLAAISPMLLVSSRDARMDSWMVLATCFAWGVLFTLEARPSGGDEERTHAPSYVLAWYAVALATLVYSHPLGLLTAVSLALASALNARAYGLDVKRWAAMHLGAAILFAPWLRHYLHHEPELVVGRLPIRFLFGTLIGFTGGNILSLPAVLGLIALGLISIRARGDSRGGRILSLQSPTASVALLIWWIVPLLLIWGYSRLSHPVLGPARDTLCVAPAYLILAARGLTRLPRWLGGLAGLGISSLAFLALPTLVYAPDLTADWRAMAAELDRRDPSAIEPVMVIANDPDRNREIVAARYYLARRRPLLALPCPVADVVALRRARPPRLWVAIGTRHGWLTAELPPSLLLRRTAETLDVPGLRLIAVNPDDLP